MSKKLKFVLLTSFSSKLGYGHFNRCKILAEELIKKGHKALLIVNTFDIKFKSTKHWIKNDNIEKNYPKADVCIVDKYYYGDRYYKNLRKFYEKIVIFDDCEFKVPNNIFGVINPNIYAHKSQYPTNLKIWSGKKYIILRDEFLKKRKLKKRNNIFLCVGGSDPTNQIDRLIKALLKKSILNINVIYGPGHKNIRNIKKWENNKQIIAHHNPKDISKLMSQAKYAISSAGSMLYELKSQNTPTICLALANNQKILGQEMNKFTSINYLGFYKYVTDVKLIKAIQREEKKNITNHHLIKNDLFLYGSKKLAVDLCNYFLLIDNKKNTPYTVSDIKNEYNYSANEKEDFKKLRWGSEKSMNNRYNFIIDKVISKNIKDWLDVGSGTGNLQFIIKKKFPEINSIGLELSEKLFNIAKKRNTKLKIKFFNMDFLKYNKNNFDLITCIGVMSKSNITLHNIFSKSSKLLKKNGLLIMDFKNKNWEKFNSTNFFPEAKHTWYEKNIILNEIKKFKKLDIVEFIGYKPNTNQKVLTNQSHTNYLIVKKKY